MNGVQAIPYAPFNAKMTKFCAISDKIQEVVTIQTNVYQKEPILMVILVLELAQCHVMNPNKLSAVVEYYQMDVTNLIFVWIEHWIMMESCAQEFVHRIVNREKLFNQN